jgi:ABC-2 type transport system ATP-binding protein
MTQTNRAPVATAAPPARVSAAEPSIAPAILMEAARREFGDVVAVERMDLTVQPGTILGVIGPSGAGKTTTIRMLTGGIGPTSGRVRVMGEEPLRFTRRARNRIGYMPQQFSLYPDLTARENVDLVASLYGMLGPRRWRRTREVLDLMQLWDAQKRRAADLSGGMQRRLELACTLVHDPQLLFLDEPTSGLDPVLRAMVWEEIRRLRGEGRTLLLTTQHVTEAEECDEVVLIANGRLVARSSPDGLRRLAVGGDLIEVVTEGVFDGGVLGDLPMVRSVDQLGGRRLRITVDDAGTALPDVVDAVQSRGGAVASAREERLGFDEIFAVLVERDRHEADGADVARPVETAGAGSR